MNRESVRYCCLSCQMKRGTSMQMCISQKFASLYEKFNELGSTCFQDGCFDMGLASLKFLDHWNDYILVLQLQYFWARGLRKVLSNPGTRRYMKLSLTLYFVKLRVKFWMFSSNTKAAHKFQNHPLQPPLIVIMLHILYSVRLLSQKSSAY